MSERRERMRERARQSAEWVNVGPPPSGYSTNVFSARFVPFSFILLRERGTRAGAVK